MKKLFLTFLLPFAIQYSYCEIITTTMIPEMPGTKVNVVISHAQVKEAESQLNYLDSSQEVYDALKNAKKNATSLPYVFSYSDGRKYLLQKALGDGSTSFIYKAKDLKTGRIVALRTPKMSGRILNDLINSYDSFKKSEIRIPEIYNSNKGEYAAMELMDLDLSLEEFLGSKNGLPKDEFEFRMKKLEDFAEKTKRWDWTFEIDGKPENIVYDKKLKEWVFPDWTGELQRSRSFSPRKKVSIEDFSKWRAEKSSLAFIDETDDNLLINQEARKKVKAIFRKNVQDKINKETAKVYSKIPKKVRSLPIEEQIKYVSLKKHFLKKDEKKLRLVGELLLSVNKQEDLEKIIKHFPEISKKLREPIIDTYKFLSQKENPLNHSRLSDSLTQLYKGNDHELFKAIESFIGDGFVRSENQMLDHVRNGYLKDPSGFLDLLEGLPKHAQNEIVRSQWKKFQGYAKKISPSAEESYLRKLKKLELPTDDLKSVQKLLAELDKKKHSPKLGLPNCPGKSLKETFTSLQNLP